MDKLFDLDIYEMGLHEFAGSRGGNHGILRVPGGWLYSTTVGGRGFVTFVPYDDEFAAGSERDDLRSELKELQGTFDLMRKADQRGVELWRAEAPEERELQVPDRAHLIAWLLERLDPRYL